MGTLKRSSNPLVIGDRPNSEKSFAGKIDEVKVFNRALSDDEVASLAGVALWPGAFADVIDLMVASFQMTGDSAYITSADIFAEQALDIFLDRNTDPTVVSGTALPRASHFASHYETITGGDRLMLSLFNLSQPQGPIGKWRLDDSSGSSTAADATGISGDGSLGTAPANPTWLPSGGHTGGALQFDGTPTSGDDKVTVDGLTPQNLPTAFTYAAWINPTGTGEGGVGRVFAHEASALDDFYMCLSSGGKIETSIRNTANGLSPDAQFVSTSTVNAVNLNSWNHVAVSYDHSGDKKMHLYVNGVEVTDPAEMDSVTGTLWRGAAPLVIGNRANQQRTFAGKIDEVEVYSRALSASEIATLGGGAPSGPIGSWRLDESSGTSAADATGNGRTGTLAASPATPLWQPSGGHANGALQFDGVDDKVTVTGLTTQGLTTFTYAAWIYPTGWGQNGYGRVLSHEAANKDEFCMSVNTDNPNTPCVQAIICNTAGTQFKTVSATILPINTWSHFAVTYSDTGDHALHLYLNGVEVTYSQQQTLTGTLRRGTNPLVIGNRPPQDQPFAGKVDEGRVYDRILSTSEIAALAQ